MTRTITLAGFAVIGVALLSFQLWGMVTRRTLTLDGVVGLVVRRPVLRWLLVAGWLWLGWHVFVRVEL